ncbi:ELF3-like protein 2 [Castanea sativa]|uniref:ELF3-like protein 2 n=1 Tax=Castanea sativa TaxID=21020 RepID=UPI003F649820
MRGGKDEQKVLSPMFPRLHVNDTEKRGPKAPPRNKMALYEQLSVPSQRFTPGSASMLPIRSKNSSSLVPLISSSHAGGHQESIFTQLCNSPSSHRAENLHSYSFVGVKLDTKVASHEQNSTKPTTCQSLNATRLLSSSAKCKSLQSYKFSKFKSFSSKKLGDEDDRVCTPSQGVIPHRSNSQCSSDREKFPRLSLTPSVKLQNASDGQSIRNATIDLKSTEFVTQQAEEDSRVSQSDQDPGEGSDSITSTRYKNLVDMSLTPSNKVKNSESLKRMHATSDQEKRSSLVDKLNRLPDSNTQLQQVYVAAQDRTAHRDDIIKCRIGIGKENSSKLRSESCSRPSIGDHYQCLNGLTNGTECREEKKCGSMSALDISPDDVVGVIGEKLFWKARRAIVNQQRLFAVQVFELHRLIKVQRMIAGSPHILLEDNFYLGKPSVKISPRKKLRSEYVSEPTAPPIVKAKDNSLRSIPITEYADENVVRKFPLPSVNYDTSKGLNTEESNFGLHSANPSQPPPGNHWLVPEMSPSEGLVYKPYAVSCPTAGFMAPVYSNCGAMNLSSGSGDFLNTAYGVPATPQWIGIFPNTNPLGQTYFPPYGRSVMHQSLSGSAIEQTSPFAEVQLDGQDNQLSVGDINLTLPQQSSCNMSSPVNRVIPCHDGKFPASNGSELQGSTASSPFERAKGDALPLFPTSPTIKALDQNVPSSEHRTQVIKVVPHNPRSATESAVRIFQSIQEERKQL